MPAASPAQTKRVLMILWVAMLCALGMYFYIMQVAAREIEPGLEGRLWSIFLALAGVLAGVTLYLRMARIGGLLSKAIPLSEAEFGKLRTYYIVCFALAESVGLYGFVLYFMGSTLTATLPFFGAGLLLFVICFPRVPA